MPIEILMPALSPTMMEGNLVKWHKKEGDKVKAGDVIAEIETDKATMEVEAVDEGILGKIIVPEGTENVVVNSLIALVLEEGEDSKSLEGYKKSEETAPAASSPEAQPSNVMPIAPKEKKEEVVREEERLFITPLARRLATQGSLDLHTIQGTGPRGRIVKADIESALKGGGGAGPAATAAVPVVKFTPPPGSGFSGYEPPHQEIPLTQMRKVIAKRLQESKQTVPHFYLTLECVMDKLLEARQELNNHRPDQKLSVNDFIVRACALALMKVPDANTAWTGDRLYQFNRADVSVAVAIEGGLITPVVRDANNKGIYEISAEMKDLAKRARDGKLKPEEFQGGTFSLSNLGMYGIKEFAAVINPPQGCILAVGLSEKRPVIKDDQIEIATLMMATLSVDHRAVDGAVGARFLNAFKEYIESPLTMLL